MKKLLTIFILIISVLGGYSQTYTPSQGTPSNKPYAPAAAVPTDSRSFYYDATNFRWRYYQSTAEVLSYLNTSNSRSGGFPIYINVGGTLNPNGTWTGGVVHDYWFRSGVTNGDLVERGVWDVSGDDLYYSAGRVTIGGSTVIGKLGMYSSDGDNPTTATGFTLLNSNTATLGAQKASPQVTLIGNGFATSGSTSQNVATRLYTLPIQGTAPTGAFNIGFSINGGAYSDLYSFGSGGSASFGNTTTAASAVLSLNSTSKGFLAPRMTAVQRNAISSPATGLLVWDTDSTSLFQYTGSAWQNVRGGTGSGISGLTATRVTYAASATTLTDASGFTYTAASSTMAVPSINLSATTTTRAPLMFGTGFMTAPTSLSNGMFWVDNTDSSLKFRSGGNTFTYPYYKGLVAGDNITFGQGSAWNVPDTINSTGGGGTPSLTAQRAGYGSASNLLDATGEAAYTYDPAINRLAVDTVMKTRTHYVPYSGQYEIIHNTQADTPTMGSRPYGRFSRWHEAGTLNADGQRDYVDGYGYNTTNNGGRWNTNEAALWWATENHYIAYEGADPQFEWYMQMIPKSGSGGYRIHGIDVDKVAGGAVAYWRLNSVQFFPSGSSIVPYYTMTPGAGIFAYSGTAPQLTVSSTGGSPNSQFQILGTNDGSGTTALTAAGGNMELNSPGFNFKSSTNGTASHDFFFNSNHAGSSGYLFAAAKQAVQKFVVANSGQTIVGVDVLGGGSNITGYQFQANHLSLFYTGVKIGGFAGGFIKDSAAILDVESTTKGVLFPRMTAVQRAAISSPVDGLMVYDTDTLDLMVYKSSAWYRAGGGTLGGAALASINGQNAAVQLLTIGTAGLLPNWTQTGSNTNVLNIPNAATASVTGGLLSKTQYDALNSLYTGKASGNTAFGGTGNGENLILAATTTGNGQVWFWHGSSYIAVDYPGVANTSRITSPDRIQYISTRTTGIHHLFSSQIGAGFTGDVVQIDVDGETVGVGQNILSVKGNADIALFQMKANGNLVSSGLGTHGTPAYMLAHTTDSTIINLASVPVNLGGTGLTATTVGGILVGSSTSAFTNLTIGANGTYLGSNGTTASWVTKDWLTSSEGTYTPTITIVTNLSGSPTATVCNYKVVGTSIEVWGQISGVDPTATGAWELGISFPSGFAYSAANNYACVGSAGTDVLNEVMTIYGDDANDRAALKGLAVDVASRTVNFRFISTFTLP